MPLVADESTTVFEPNVVAKLTEALGTSVVLEPTAACELSTTSKSGAAVETTVGLESAMPPASTVLELKVAFKVTGMS